MIKKLFAVLFCVMFVQCGYSNSAVAQAGEPSLFEQTKYFLDSADDDAKRGLCRRLFDVAKQKNHTVFYVSDEGGKFELNKEWCDVEDLNTVWGIALTAASSMDNAGIVFGGGAEESKPKTLADCRREIVSDKHWGMTTSVRSSFERSFDVNFFDSAKDVVCSESEEDNRCVVRVPDDSGKGYYFTSCCTIDIKSCDEPKRYPSIIFNRVVNGKLGLDFFDSNCLPKQ